MNSRLFSNVAIWRQISRCKMQPIERTRRASCRMPAPRSDRRRLILEMDAEPISSQSSHFFQSARLLEKMGSAGHDAQLLFASKLSKGLLVQSNDFGVKASHEKQGGSGNQRQALHRRGPVS